MKNKYEITVADIKKCKFDKHKLELNKSKLWRNDIISAWCQTGVTDGGFYSGEDSYWLGLYDNGKVDINFSSYEGMCGYVFNEFGKSEDIENKYDLQIQEMALNNITKLIDIGVLILNKGK